HAAVELEHAIGGVFGGGVVVLAVLIPAVGDVHGGLRVDRLHAAEEVLEDVVPVREHVDDDAAAVFGAVVPAGALGGLPVTLEDPVAELTAHREDASEETGLD